MGRRTAILLAFVALVAPAVLLAPRASADAPQPPPYVLVVHPSNPNRTLSRRFVSEAFLKKATRWPNDEVIRPVDQLADSKPRERFSEDVLRKSVAEVKSYWEQIIFSGRGVPPPELDDDAAVLQFVAKNRGAIGYVSGSTRLVDVRPVGLE